MKATGSRQRLASTLTFAVVLVTAFAAGSATAAAPIVSRGTGAGAGPQSCDRIGRQQAAPEYGWPVKPFHRQHPVRGYFGDPRIGGHGGTSFHFGVDVSAPDGTPVYATTNGSIGLSKNHRGSVYIRRSDGAVFSYWHIKPAVRSGDRAIAYKTVLGHIVEGWGHVHFAERRNGRPVNPLRPAAMGPYADHTCPQVVQVRFERAGGDTPADSLGGSLDIVLEGFDPPAMSAAQPWRDMPVTPALVRWRILDRQGRALRRWWTAFDVRMALPDKPFDQVFTPATQQNHPNRPGTYDFYLAREWNSSTVAGGSFSIEVLLLDTRGNRARVRVPLLFER